MERTVEFPIAFHLVAHVPGPRNGKVDAAIVDNCVAFAKQHADQLSWFVDDRTGRFKMFEPEYIHASEQYLHDPPGAPRRAWMAHGGETKRTPSVWSMYGSLDGDPSNNMELRWPIDYWERRWSEAVEEVAARLRDRPLFQGCAGFSFAEVLGEESYSKARAALAARFQGVDIAQVSSRGHSSAEGLAPANWLTAIGNVFVEQLGGRKAFASLGDDIVVHELGTGVMIQAGEKPSLGDVNAGDTLPLYREVAKLIMPARYHGTVIWTNVSLADAKAWFARLDP